MNASSQRLCAWAGPGAVILFFIGFGGFAGFLPPPSPAAGLQQIADIFSAHTNSIRFGLLLSMFAAALFAPLVAVISVQLKRIEGEHTPLSNTQLALGSLLVVFFIFPVMWWQTAAFRPESARSPEGIQLLNDLAWIPFVGVVSTGVIQALGVGLTILQDTRDVPIFPRWLGYYSLWSALIFVPGGIIVFFKSGIFAWDGLIGFWTVLAVFALWVLLMSFAVLRAINAQNVEYRRLDCRLRRDIINRSVSTWPDAIFRTTGPGPEGTSVQAKTNYRGRLLLGRPFQRPTTMVSRGKFS